MWEFVWQEVVFPIAHDDDWREAERIIDEEARAISATDEAKHAMEEMQRRYPVPHSELEARVYARATDNHMGLSARFVVPVRTSRTAVNDLTRRVRDRLDEAGISIASTTMDLTITAGSERTTRESSRSG